MSSRNYTRAVRMWMQQFSVGTDICAEIAACIDAAVAEERAAVVALLREEERLHEKHWSTIVASSLRHLGDIIERGEHRREEDE